MMWTREELKTRAKKVLRGCFWSSVVVALITGILTGGFSSSRSNVQNVQEVNYNEIQSGGESLVDSATQMIAGSGHQAENLLARVAGMSFGVVILGIGISVVLLGLAFGILVGSPIQVGANRFFLRAREESAGMGELFWAFRQRQFWHIVLIMLVMKVKIFLWGLLFVIPGIVKSYEYRMVPYILAENPDLPMSEVFALSREMTMNQKMDIFVLDLSFIPWEFLSNFTLGLAGIFWVNPYEQATGAELYAVLRQNVLNSGFANGIDLPGFESRTDTF